VYGGRNIDEFANAQRGKLNEVDRFFYDCNKLFTHAVVEYWKAFKRERNSSNEKENAVSTCEKYFNPVRDWLQQNLPKKTDEEKKQKSQLTCSLLITRIRFSAFCHYQELHSTEDSPQTLHDSV